MGAQEPPARRSARLVAVAAQRAGPPLHYPDKRGNEVGQDSIGETQQNGSEFSRR